MSAIGCAANPELTTIQDNLADLQLQILQLRKLAATGEDVESASDAIDARLQELVAAQAGVGADVRELATQVEQLSAKLEDTHFRLAQLSQQIAATAQELQAVRNVAESRASAVGPGTAPRTTTRRPETSDPQALYDRAYNDYLNGNYDLAILGFEQYLESYPTTDLADNATYWIGECFYRQGEFQQAIAQFDEVLTRYGRSDRIPSALLKKGYAYLELGQRAQGIVHLQSVVCEAPGSDEARIARQRLVELGIDVDC